MHTQCAQNFPLLWCLQRGWRVCEESCSTRDKLNHIRRKCMVVCLGGVKWKSPVCHFKCWLLWLIPKPKNSSQGIAKTQSVTTTTFLEPHHTCKYLLLTMVWLLMMCWGSAERTVTDSKFSLSLRRLALICISLTYCCFTPVLCFYLFQLWSTVDGSSFKVQQSNLTLIPEEVGRCVSLGEDNKIDSDTSLVVVRNLFDLRQRWRLRNATLVWVVKFQEALVLLGWVAKSCDHFCFEGQTWVLKGEQSRVPHLKTVRVNASNARVVAFWIAPMTLVTASIRMWSSGQNHITVNGSGEHSFGSNFISVLLHESVQFFHSHMECACKTPDFALTRA